MIITIILLLFCHGIISEGTKSKEYQLLPDLSGHKCKPSDAIGTILAQSYFVCAYQCLQHPGCVSFFYSNMTTVCERCNATYDVIDDGILDVEGRSVYYSTKVEEVVEDLTTAEDTTIAEDTTVDEATMDKKFEYVGCYSAFCEGQYTAPCKATYKEAIYGGITVDKCYEICKSFSTFSIWLLTCYCDMDYDTPAPDFCVNSCSGNYEQECGGDMSSSIYRIK